MTRLSNVSHGQMEQFVRRLAGSGFTAEDLIRVSTDSRLMKNWVSLLHADQDGGIVPEDVSGILCTPVTTFFTDKRVSKTLLREGIQTLEELVDWTEYELRGIRNFGEKSLETVRSALAPVGIHLPEIRQDDSMVIPPERIFELDRGTNHPWKRSSIGHLPLSQFVKITREEGEVATARFSWSMCIERIEILFSMSEDELVASYGELAGPVIYKWLMDEYAPWVP